MGCKKSSLSQFVFFTMMAGCGVSAEAGADANTGVGPSPDAELSLIPRDLTTGAELCSQTPGVQVATAGGPTDFPIRYGGYFASHLRLFRLPNHEPHDGTVTTEELFASHYLVSLSPATPLVGGWYVLEFDASGLPSTFRSDGPNGNLGTLTTRFHCGSLPILLANATADGDQAVTPIRLTLGSSERLFLPAGTILTDIVELAGQSVGQCSPGGADTPERELAAAGRTDLICEGVMLTEAITLRVHPGLQSQEGVPLRGGDGSTDISVTWNPSLDGPLAPQQIGADILLE